MRAIVPWGIGLSAIFLLFPTAVQAQLEGSYLGTSVEDGLPAMLEHPAATPLDLLPEATQLSGTEPLKYQGRLDLEGSAFSLRGNVYLDDEAAAIIPSVTYDISVMERANVYFGGGYAIINGQAQGTEIGDQNGFVLSAGAEAELLPGTIIYGNTQYGINTQADGERPMTFQLGIGRSL
ncbi:MAG: hypothetical protein F6K00_27620 [Leptolyngbya sp. SIOISBB]|nr:hypothetical protein [Leptolyngbya sp. SIOISBB]